MSEFISPSKFNTPVLFTIFNRPEAAKVVFECIRYARPPRLYVAADGPRSHVKNDFEKCNETRSILSQVDWPCEVKTLFRTKNVGCGEALSSGLTWFFEQEDEGIILEDDCLASKSFFWYCQELLQRYRHDTRLMHIGGNNFLNGSQKDSRYSYYFSRNGYVWGWATWRRAWKMFDFKMQHYSSLKREGYFDSYFANPLEKIYRLRKLDQVAAGKIDTWDFQWDFARFINSGLAIVPVKNLVRNIGFGIGATHTRNVNDEYRNMELHEIDFPLQHPPFVLNDYEADNKYFTHQMKKKFLSKFVQAYKGIEAYARDSNGK